MKSMKVVLSVLLVTGAVSMADVITFEAYAPGQYVNVGNGVVTFGNFMSVEYSSPLTPSANTNYDPYYDSYGTQNILIQNLMGVSAGAFGYFDLNGAAFGTLQDGLQLTITGMDLSGGEISQTIDFTGLAGEMNYFELTGFDDVSSVIFTPVGGGTFFVDDMTINQAALPHSPIPAPGAVFLGSLGIGLVGWLRRRKSF